MPKNPMPSMFELVDQLPAQIVGSRSLLEEAALPRWERPARVTVCGMGGSAAAATLARGIYEQQAEILVARRYRIPAPWQQGSFFVFSSYSGNTEETLSAYDQLRVEAPGAPRAVISSGGALVERAVADAVPVLRLPTGLPPRASLGWGLGALVRMLGHLGVVDGAEEDLSAAAERLREGVERWTPGGSDRRLQGLAERLAGRLPLLYAGDGLAAAVAERWRAQLNENSKCLVSTAQLPELDHNEVVGWEKATPARAAAFVLALRDADDHPRVQRRFDVTREVLGDRVPDWVEVRAEPGPRLVRAMDLAQQGDYLSVYLAAAHDVDPTPVRRIDELKARLAEKNLIPFVPKEQTMSERQLFTSESVTEGHPDKVADAISDSVVDAIMEKDPDGRVACETLVTTGMALVAGEISTETYVDIPSRVRGTLKAIGYTDPSHGFDYETCAILTSIDEQSGDIAMGVDREKPEDQGAGDQGLMFGYATRENDEFMPSPINLAHKMARRLAEVRKDGTFPYLRPDGKTQVTLEYDGDRPVRADAVVLSTQHGEDVQMSRIREDMTASVIHPILEASAIEHDAKTRIYVNPTGRFVLGGPHADAGLTGRKIIVDTYGGMGRHGGGAFSGKDPSKVDRSASYAARHVAKNLVAAGVAQRLEVQLAYAIGVAEPVSVRVESFGTAQVEESNLAACVRDLWDLRPAGIISSLDLRRGVYRPTSAYGHFGREARDGLFTWERLDRVEEVKRWFGA